MYPGLTAADCQVAEFRYRQLVSDGQQQQCIAGVHASPSNTRRVMTALRLRLGTLLVRAGQRMQGAHVAARNGLNSVAVDERGAFA